MRVGIMSMQRVVNYGSYLQAYGLKKTIEQTGNTVEFVDYKIESSLVSTTDKKENYILSRMKNIMRMFLPSYRKWRRDQIRSNQSFAEFISAFTTQYLPELGITEERNECPELDALVIGSDEVFNCTQAGELVGYSRQLFGAENHAAKLISYAASFGSTTMEKLCQYGIREEVQKYLERFDAISVRDHNSLDIVKTLCGIDAEYHIDPVLLYDFPEVDKIEISLKNYIVVYAYAGRISDEEAESIKAFAREKGKKLISLGFWQTFCDEFVLATPLEVLAYIRDADYVITDTFHGSVFSIKYQKKFGTIIRESNQQKLSDLLMQFGLNKHLIANLNNLSSALDLEIDKRFVLNQISLKQNRAKAYLNHNLSKEKCI